MIFRFNVFQLTDFIFDGKVLLIFKFFRNSSKEPYELALVRWYDIFPEQPELYGYPQLHYTKEYNAIPIGSIYQEAHVIPRFDKDNRQLALRMHIIMPHNADCKRVFSILGWFLSKRHIKINIKQLQAMAQMHSYFIMNAKSKLKYINDEITLEEFDKILNQVALSINNGIDLFDNENDENLVNFEDINEIEKAVDLEGVNNNELEITIILMKSKFNNLSISLLFISLFSTLFIVSSISLHLFSVESSDSLSLLDFHISCIAFFLDIASSMSIINPSVNLNFSITSITISLIPT
ncbi:hypothetical protein RclHR1_00720027 [Rhizophagus clarus]|uniref:Uncharacterized protein n=1 Tax=Rhizophagus clarus TaxID=94130 RepID=A0A2Z6RV71_9GLOM|nr:hypothetical protein RclHR1_00720027 [Rhizophagus clarus]